MRNDKKLLPVLALSAMMVLVSCGGNGGSSSGASSAPASTPASSESSVPSEPSSESSVEPAKAGSGVKSFIREDYDTRTDILGKLEKYAVDNKIAGMPLYASSGYVMYSRTVEKGTSNYIKGYGFGTLREGKLNGTLIGETGKIKPTYLHTWESSDPGTINALDSDGSQVSDLYSYIGASYFSTKMNATKDGYEWYGTLSSKDHPWIVDDSVAEGARPAASAEEMGSKWRIYLRTGEAGGVQYRTNSANADRAAYDGTYATIDDYLNTWKVFLTKSVGFYRGEELAEQTGKYGFKGAASYFNATNNYKVGSAEADALWDKYVGIKKGHSDENGDYLEFEFLAPTNRFFAMYATSESTYTPMPLSFFNLVTDDQKNVGNYASYNSDKTSAPIDNVLCTGPYYLESWESGKVITFAKNDSWVEYDNDSHTPLTGIYSIPGVYVSVLSGYDTDQNVAIKEFLNGNLHSASLPSSYLPEYKDDPRTCFVPASSNFKLNMNTMTQEAYDEYFGGDYECKPWMANDDFTTGLFYAIDRPTFAASRGYTAAVDYFSDAYISNPETGESYNDTQQHKDAIADFWGSTVDNGGYSDALAKQAFSSAVDTMIADGTITDGQELHINIWWMYTYMISSWGTEIAGYFQDAFNNCASALAHSVTLVVDNEAVTTWSDVYYKHLMTGEFDLGFGSITGNSLDPLNFMEVLKSNNSSGFTLNWGPDTSEVGIEYDGELWSFDTLWAAADHGVAVYKGVELADYSFAGAAGEYADDGSLVFTFGIYSALDLMKALYVGGDEDAKKVLCDAYGTDESGEPNFNTDDPFYSIEFLDCFVGGYNGRGYMCYGYVADYDAETGDPIWDIDDSGINGSTIDVYEQEISGVTCTMFEFTISASSVAAMKAGYYGYMWFGMEWNSYVDGVPNEGKYDYKITVVPEAPAAEDSSAAE